MNALLFMGLSLALWFINAWNLSGSALSVLWAGLGATLVSITVWASLGLVFSMFASFSLSLLKVNVRLDLWRKINIGLALGVVFEPVLGIPV